MRFLKRRKKMPVLVASIVAFASGFFVLFMIFTLAEKGIRIIFGKNFTEQSVYASEESFEEDDSRMSVGLFFSSDQMEGLQTVGTRRTYSASPAALTLSGVDIVKEVAKTLPKTPHLAVGAREFLVADLKTYEVLLQKNPGIVTPIASLTKLMSAYVALEVLSAQHVVSISARAIETYGTEGQLIAGEKLPLSELLYALLLESSNDAAEAIAEAFGRERFMEQMNAAARQFGLIHTRFHDPSGLSSENVSTAEELFKLAQKILAKRPEVFEITKERSHDFGAHRWHNTSHFLVLTGFKGGKNGYTDEANRTAIAIFEIPEGPRDTRDIILVLLQSADRYSDAARILEYVRARK